jgi:hypothetical protein
MLRHSPAISGSTQRDPSVHLAGQSVGRWLDCAKKTAAGIACP